MKLHVAWISKTKEPALAALTAEYVKRIRRFHAFETSELPDEAGLARLCDRLGGSTHLVLADSRGKQMSSEEIAAFIQGHQDRGTAALVFAVGGADGWSDEIRKRSAAGIAFGRITLPHELARVVLLEQIYRAFTILKGHPYHTGH